jgi:hypothetical protein
VETLFVEAGLEVLELLPQPTRKIEAAAERIKADFIVRI